MIKDNLFAKESRDPEVVEYLSERALDNVVDICIQFDISLDLLYRAISDRIKQQQ